MLSQTRHSILPPSLSDMAIMPMQKVAVLAHHASREALLEQLQRMGSHRGDGIQKSLRRSITRKSISAPPNCSSPSTRSRMLRAKISLRSQRNPLCRRMSFLQPRKRMCAELWTVCIPWKRKIRRCSAVSKKRCRGLQFCSLGVGFPCASIPLQRRSIQKYCLAYCPIRKSMQSRNLPGAIGIISTVKR